MTILHFWNVSAKEANERLDRLQDSVEWLKEELQEEDRQCYGTTTGSFHNPAHNCSHIAYNNLNATSGTYTYMYMYT